MAVLLPCFLDPSAPIHPHLKLHILVTHLMLFLTPLYATFLSGYGLETIKLKFLNVYYFPKSSVFLFHSHYHVLIWLGCIWKEATFMMLYLLGPYLLMPHLCSNCSIHTVSFPIFPLAKLPGISEEQHDARLYRLEHFQFVIFNWQY